jgi:hypothetical protein
MTAPGWAEASLAVVMLAIAACCAARLVIWRLRDRQAEPEADALHLLMATAMAGMLDSKLELIPATAWIALFTFAAVWFAWHSVRSRIRFERKRWQCSHPVPHAVESGAMTYMLWPTLPRGHGVSVAMPGMSGHSFSNPALSLVLVLFMLGYILWTTDQLTTNSIGMAAGAKAVPAIDGSTAGSGLGSRSTPSRPAATRPSAAVRAGARLALAPRVAASYKIVMSAAMGYMLVSMI